MNRTSVIRRKVTMTKRSPSGYALLSVMTVSAFSMMLIVFLLGLTVSLVQSRQVFAERSVALRDAELGIDYVLRELNNSARGEVSTIDFPEDFQERRLSMPPELVPFSGGAKSIVRIRVQRFKLEQLREWQAWGSPLLLDESWLPMEGEEEPLGWKANWLGENSPSAPLTSYYWSVEVTAWRGVLSASARSIVGPNSAKSIAQAQTDFFKTGVIANQAVELQPSTGTLNVRDPNNTILEDTGDGADYAATVRTNGSATIGSTNLNGNLVFSSSASPPNSEQLVNASADTQISGRVVSNIAIPSGENFEYTSGPDANSSDTILADADNPGALAPRTGNNQSPMALAGDYASFAPTQVPTAIDATPLPLFPQNDGQGAVNDISLTPGIYEGASLDSTNAAAKIIVNDAIQPGQTTQIYINGGSGQAIELDTSMFDNKSSANNLMIFVNGDGDVHVNLNPSQDFKGMIYAPKSKITTTGSGNFTGSLIGNQVSVKHRGDFNIVAYNPNALYDKAKNNSDPDGPKPGIAGSFRMLTWQHVNAVLVSK